MLSDPLVIPALFPNAGNLPCISREPQKSVYAGTIGSKKITLTISHQQTKSRERCLARVDMNDIVTDPLLPATSKTRSVSTYLVIDYDPSVSNSGSVLPAVVDLLGLLGVSSTIANIGTSVLGRIIEGES